MNDEICLHYSKTRKLKNWLREAVTKPYNVIVILALVLLTYLILVPMYEMIKTTFLVSQADLRQIRGAEVGAATLYHWKRVLFSNLSKSLLYVPLRNSLMIGMSVSVISIIFGATLAWLMVRTDLPWKKALSLIVIIPYMLPSWCKSLAWLTVFKNERIGGSQGFLSAIGITVPDWLAYGPIAIILVLSLHYYAYSYLLVSAALRSINSELEEMGEIVGASKAKILRKITFPLILPAVLSSFILTFSKSIGTFGVPAFLGMKINYYTISTMLYSNIRQRQTNTGFAMSLILISIAAITVYINQLVIGSRKSFATIGGKGGRRTPITLGKSKYPILIVLLLFIGAGVFLPLVILLLQTFMLRGGDYSLANFTLHYWIGSPNPMIFENEPGVFKNPIFWQSVWNTLRLVFTTAIVATLCGQLLGYIVSRGRGTLSGRVVEQLTFLPYLIPSIAFGAIYLSMFSQPHLFLPSLYGTFALLVLVSVVKHLPFSCRAGTSNMLQIGIELEEAATIAGASFAKRFARIVFPLSKAGFLSGFMLIFISIMKELDLIILVITPKLGTLPYMAFSYANGNFPQFSNVVAVIMFAIVLLVYLIANRISNADLSSGIGG